MRKRRMKRRYPAHMLAVLRGLGDGSTAQSSEIVLLRSDRVRIGCVAPDGGGLSEEVGLLLDSMEESTLVLDSARPVTGIRVIRPPSSITIRRPKIVPRATSMDVQP